MNRVILSGRLTADPEIGYTQNEKKVASFTIAVNKDKENADFIPCQAWGKTADIFERYIKKGTKVAVIGRICISKYEDKNGEKKIYTYVNVSEMEFAESGQKKEEAKEPGYNDGANEDFVPF